MNIYFASFDHAPKKWDGRVFLVTLPVPQEIDECLKLLRVEGLTLKDGMTKTEAKNAYDSFNWAAVGKKLAENDMFLGKKSHIEFLRKYILCENFNPLNYDDIDSMSEQEVEEERVVYTEVNEEYLSLFGYRLEENRMPISPISINGEYVPIACKNGTFIIPFFCPNKYKHWMNGGMEIEEMLETFIKQYVDETQYARLLHDYCGKKTKGENKCGLS